MPLLKKYLELDGIEELRQVFIKKGITKEFKKNDFLVRRGQNHNPIGFILKGGFRYIGYSTDGKEQIVGYSFENDFAADYATFQMQQSPVIDVLAITECTVAILTYDELNEFFENCPIPLLRSQIAESLLNDIGMRLLSMYCDSPEERYTKLISRYPEILNMVNLKEIASLIKVTPETLSRIRRKLLLQPNP
jgi:CRP-like cAMP-binding protein